MYFQIHFFAVLIWDYIKMIMALLIETEINKLCGWSRKHIMIISYVNAERKF